MQHNQKEKENYLLEPLGKSTTKEDHERIKTKTEGEKEIRETVTNEQKGDHQEMKSHEEKTWKLLNS